VKSTEIYSLLRAELGPAMKSLGFKRQRSFLSWSRHLGGLNTVLWCQVSRDGWDQYAGSKFVLEFQRSEGDEPGMPATVRARYSKLILAEEREQVHSLQNDVIASLQRPPGNHAALQVSPEVTRWYMKNFERETTPYDPEEDLWFRYAEPTHVKRWGELIAQSMPKLLQRFESGA
jgi:hypothetical protein